MLVRTALLLVALALSAGLLQSASVTAVSNLGQFADTNVAVGKSSGFDFQEAISFTTGPSATEAVRVTVPGDTMGNLTNLTVILCSGLTTAGPTGILSRTVNDATLSSPVALAPNSTYWLVVAAPNTAEGSTFRWEATRSLAEDAGALPGWTIGDLRWVTNNGGASWMATTIMVTIPKFSIEVNVLPPVAPVITAQPSAQKVDAGANVTLAATATGNPVPTYQWRKDGVAVPGATNNSLVLTAVSSRDAGTYSVVVANSAGSVTSRGALLEVVTPLAAVSNLAQPFQTNLVVSRDTEHAMSFTTGAAIADLAGVTFKGTGTLSGLTLGLYRNVDSNGPSGLITTFAVSVNPGASGYTHVATTRTRLAANSTYWLVASAPGAAAGASVLWQATGTASADANTLRGWSVGDTRWARVNGAAAWIAVRTVAGQFDVKIKEPFVALTAEPSAQTAIAGDTITLSAGAIGSPVPTYQWRKDGVALPGATNATLELTSAARSHAGSYSVVVSNGADSVTSAAVTVEVIPASFLSNVSVRTAMATGQVLTVGAVVNGAPKPILLRAAGPALNSFNLAGMADPRLDLFTTGAQPAATNDDWPAALAATFASVGAFPFNLGSRDAALAQPLTGPFTIQIRGTGAGTVLVEAYDAVGGTSSRMINFSVRNRVGTGADILIAGFNVAGTGSKQVLVRAVGPGLVPLGVPSTLADPRLQVLNSSGAVIATNDDWEPTLATTFSAVGAFPLPANSRDSAVLVLLNGGASYTVQVAGADGGVGEALVEVYEVF